MCGFRWGLSTSRTSSPISTRRSAPPGGSEVEEGPRRRALLALLLVLALLAGGFFLIRALVAESAREDCLAAGRRDCPP